MNRLQVKIHSLRHFVDFSFLPVASIEVDARVDGSVEFVFFGVRLDQVLNGKQLLASPGQVKRIGRRARVVDERRLEMMELKLDNGCVMFRY